MIRNIYFAPDDPGGAGSDDAGDPPDNDDSQAPGGTGSPTDPDLVPREELQKVNREAAKYRRERNDLQNRLKQFEDAEKTEIERLSGENADLKKRLDTAQLRARELRVQVLAAKVGISPDARQDASKLLDWDAVGDPDSDTSLEEALQNLLKARPYLKGAARGADGGAGADGRTPGAGMNEAIRRAAGRT